MIELYPAHYYWWGVWHLAQSAQVRYYAYFPIWTEHDSNLRNSTTTSQQQLEREQESPQWRLLKDYGKHCASFGKRTQVRDIPTIEPSIPHDMVLLRRAVTDRENEIRRQQQQQQEQQQGGNNHSHSVVSSSYVPQIARMDVGCGDARNPRASLKRVEVHVDDDPPPSFFTDYSG